MAASTASSITVFIRGGSPSKKSLHYFFSAFTLVTFFNKRQGSQRYILVYSEPIPPSLRETVYGEKWRDLRVRKENFMICRVTLGRI